MSLKKKFTSLALAISSISAPFFVAGCTSPESAKNALEDQGFSDVQTTGYRVFGCSKDDQFHTGFTAKNPRGKVVQGVVCSGVFKGSTIRYDH